MAPQRPNSPPAERFDHPLEFLIPSRSQEIAPGIPLKHKCELRAYGRNGECSCKDFTTRFGPILKRGINAEQALDMALVKIRKGHDPRDCLRCDHLIEAFRLCAEAYVLFIDEAERAHEKSHGY